MNTQGNLLELFISHLIESGRQGGTLGFDQRVMVVQPFPPGQPPNAEIITDSEQNRKQVGRRSIWKELRPKQVPFKHLRPHPGVLLG